MICLKFSATGANISVCWCVQSMDWILMLTGTAATSVRRSSKTKPPAATVKKPDVYVRADVSLPPDIFIVDLQDRTSGSTDSGLSANLCRVSPELAC